MGLFKRFTDIINANLNSMLDKAEQPDKMIRLIISEMEETLIDVRSTIAKHIAEKKHLTRKIKDCQETIIVWQDKAELALSKSHDDLAKSALTAKHKCQDGLTQLNEEYSQITDILKAIQEDSQRLNDKLTEAKYRQKTLLLRQNSAQVRLNLRERATVHNIDEAMTKFELYQQKIDRLEAEVESYDLTENKDLSSQIAALAQNENIEAELAEMKKNIANA